MKFINRHAYIMVAIKGKNFCKSAIAAVALLVENVLRLAAVNIVGDSLIFLGKVPFHTKRRRSKNEIEKRRRPGLGWSTMFVTALSSWEKSVPRGHLAMLHED
jgi:hypothetical protein